MRQGGSSQSQAAIGKETRKQQAGEHHVEQMLIDQGPGDCSFGQPDNRVIRSALREEKMFWPIPARKDHEEFLHRGI